MKSDTLNICQVSLAGNIPIIQKNLKNFENFYKKVIFYIIVPSKDLLLFKKKIKNKNVKIISENDLIKFSKFKKISNFFLKNSRYYKEIQKRLSWYYQQILKLSFVINFINKKNKNIIIWDADTIIIKKIKFFHKKKSIKFGTTSEYHKAYYKTNKTILRKLPRYFVSSLCQFVCLSVIDQKFLKKKLKINKIKKNIAFNISKIIMRAVKESHEIYNGSMFSEYELIGQSNLLLDYSKQKLISGLRDRLDGVLTDYQIKILKVLNFKYVAYEHTHQNFLSKNMLKRNQSWLRFLALLIKKLSNNLFRGLRHHVKYMIY